MSAPKRWTTREVADHFRVQPPTVLRWMREGKLRPADQRPVRRGAYLFDEAEVLALGEQRADVDHDTAEIAAIIDSELRLRRARGA